MKKVLTVVIPTYNMEKYLKNCLDSFICENKDLIEVLVVNDGSKDGSLKIAKEYETKYPDVFKVIDKENGGHGSTINAGLKIARGKYFKVVDADDWVNTENFNRFIKILETLNHDIVCTNYNKIYDQSDTNKIADVCKGLSGECEINKLTDVSFLAMHALTCKTENIRNERILEHCFYVDVMFNVYCYVNSDSVFFIPDMDVYQYRLGRAGQSVSMEGYFKHRENHTRMLQAIIPYIYGINDVEKKKIMIHYISMFVLMEYSIYAYAYRKDKTTVDEIIAFDEWLKQYKEVYECSNKGLAKGWRKTKFKHCFWVRVINFIRVRLSRLFGK